MPKTAVWIRSQNRTLIFRDHIQRIKQSKDVPIMIAANKIDLASDRQVDAEKGLSFAEEQLGDKTAYMETSGTLEYGYQIGVSNTRPNHRTEGFGSYLRSINPDQFFSKR